MDNSLIPVRFHLNGREYQDKVKPHELLVDFIRNRLQLTGTKRSCEIGICGVCTVLVNGKAVSSCCLFAFEIDGKDLLTIEGLADGDRLHPLQDSFIECAGFQCGFCTPGMILLAKAYLDENLDVNRGAICEYMDANICRCGCYQMIIESILRAANQPVREP